MEDIILGFSGGNTFHKDGTVSDFFFFFSAISLYADKALRNNLITEKLYKKYLKLEEIDDCVEQIKHIEQIFENISLQKIEFRFIQLEKEKTMLDFKKRNLKDLFYKFFISFYDVAVYAKKINEKFNFYKPVMISQSSIQSLIKNLNIPNLEEYDNLQGAPFWLREYLKEYPDTVLPFE